MCSPNDVIGTVTHQELLCLSQNKVLLHLSLHPVFKPELLGLLCWSKGSFATLNEVLVKYLSKRFWLNISEFVVPYLRMIDFYYKM